MSDDKYDKELKNSPKKIYQYNGLLMIADFEILFDYFEG